ncbi:putative NADH:ubiquinone reductase (H(+)-translocating) [Helianthus debilis subsp. tardiflorus]
MGRVFFLTLPWALIVCLRPNLIMSNFSPIISPLKDNISSPNHSFTPAKHGETINTPSSHYTNKMNTDITASAKPEYPVIDRNPPFTKTVGNFNTLDYLRFTTITGISVTVGYLSGIKPGIRGPSMVTGGLIGVMGGFMYAYQNSAGRFMGFFPNDGEVARYKK